MLGLNLEDFLPPGDRARVRQAIESVFETGEHAAYETSFESPNGTLVLAARAGLVEALGYRAVAAMTGAEALDRSRQTHR